MARAKQPVAAGIFLGLAALGSGVATPSQGADASQPVAEMLGAWTRTSMDPELMPAGPKPLTNLRRPMDDPHDSGGGDPSSVDRAALLDELITESALVQRAKAAKLDQSPEFRRRQRGRHVRHARARLRRHGFLVFVHVQHRIHQRQRHHAAIVQGEVAGQMDASQQEFYMVITSAQCARWLRTTTGGLNAAGELDPAAKEAHAARVNAWLVCTETVSFRSTSRTPSAAASTMNRSRASRTV